MDKTAALQLLRTITFEKTAGGLTAPTVGKEAPKLPVVGEEGGTKQQQLFRGAAQSAQGAVESVQNKAEAATSGYSPAKGKNVSGPSGVGQSVATVMAKQPSASKVTQPKDRTGEGARKVAHVLKIAAPRLPRVPPGVAGVADDAARAASRVRGVPTPGPWSIGSPVPKASEVARLREGVKRYTSTGPADMSAPDMRRYLQALNQGTAQGSRFSGTVGGFFNRYPSPPVYGPTPVGAALADALTSAGQALGLKRTGMLASAADFVRGVGGRPEARELLAPAIKPGILRNASGEISPLLAAARMGGAGLGAYGLYRGGKALYNYATNKDGSTGQTGSGGAAAAPVTMQLSPEQARILNAYQENQRIFEQASQDLYGSKTPPGVVTPKP